MDGSMSRFVKKPIVIDAERWNGTAIGSTPIINWILRNGGTARYHDDPPSIAIDTLEGTITASPGDWIIRGVQGEFYPCKPDIFNQTYDGVEDDD
jgi:hypothetical protein